MRTRPGRCTIGAVSGEPPPKVCRVEQALGRTEICPEGACPFWSSGSASWSGHCVFERLDLRGREALVEWLHKLRAELGDDGPEPTRAERFRGPNEARAD